MILKSIDMLIMTVEVLPMRKMYSLCWKHFNYSIALLTFFFFKFSTKWSKKSNQ